MHCNRSVSAFMLIRQLVGTVQWCKKCGFSFDSKAFLSAFLLIADFCMMNGFQVEYTCGVLYYTFDFGCYRTGTVHDEGVTTSERRGSAVLEPQTRTNAVVYCRKQ